MACRNAYRGARNRQEEQEILSTISKPVVAPKVGRLLFGVDSALGANDILQNNLDQFEWVRRNKIYPNFWGRNIVGENCLTKEEIKFLHDRGCKIAAIYRTPDVKRVERDGEILAKKINMIAFELGIPAGTAIFLEIDEKETITRDYMRGFARALLEEGYTPAFKANTDANYAFDHEYSRGMQSNKELFAKCLIWAITPRLAEFEGITNSHLIHPDNWKPYAPSGITRKDIAIWQYGKDCHPILDDEDQEVMFNLNLVRNEQVIIEKMF